MKRILLLLIIMLATSPAFATQTINNSIVASTESGSQLATDLNNSFTSLISTNRGGSRPSYAATGMLWVNNVSGTLENLYVYDGNTDLLIGNYNPTTHAFSLANSLPSSVTIPSGATGTTQSANDNSTKIATTAYVDSKTSGGMVLISCQAASNSAGISWTSLPSGYATFYTTADHVVPAITNVDLVMTISTGSGFINATYWSGIFRYTASATGIGGVNNGAAWYLSSNNETMGTGGYGSFAVTIYGADSTSPSKMANWSASGLWYSGNQVFFQGGGTVTTNSARIDGIQYFMDGGSNIASGKFCLWGIKNS